MVRPPLCPWRSLSGSGHQDDGVPERRLPGHAGDNAGNQRCLESPSDSGEQVGASIGLPTERTKGEV